MHRNKLLANILTLSLLAVIALAMSVLVMKREGNLAWDDADYLRRGLRIANRAADAGPTRVIGDILHESPKPPMLVAWIAASTTLVGRTSISALIVAGSVLPYVLLLLAVALIARYHFGWQASIAAVLATLASPLSLSFGAKVMVETFLALGILLTLHFGVLILVRPSFRRGFALGAAIGMAMMTKLTVALLLPGPAIVFGILVLVRRRTTSVVSCSCLSAIVLGLFLIAGPWYARNGRIAVEFARFSSRYNIEAEGRSDQARIAERLAAIGSQVIGWPNLAVLVVVAAAGLARRKLPGDFAMLAMASMGVGTIGLLIPTYFDPRFVAPAWPVMAVAMSGGLVAIGRGRSKWIGLCLGFSLLAIGSAWSAVELVNEPGTKTYWAGRELIDELVARYGVRSIGNVGDTGDWNVCKTGLMNELRPHPEDCFVLHDLSRLDSKSLTNRLERLDALVVLSDSETLQDLSKFAPGLNQARSSIRQAIASSGRFRRIETEKIASLPPMSVYVRR